MHWLLCRRLLFMKYYLMGEILRIHTQTDIEHIVLHEVGRRTFETFRNEIEITKGNFDKSRRKISNLTVGCNTFPYTHITMKKKCWNIWME